MELRRIVDIDGNAGLYIAIAATRPIRRMFITESFVKADGSANVPQGLTFRVRNDGTAAGFTTVFEIDALTDVDSVPQQIRLGSEFAAHAEKGELIGLGPQPIVGQTDANGVGQLGTHVADVRSATATSTSVEVVEYE